MSEFSKAYLAAKSEEQNKVMLYLDHVDINDGYLHDAVLFSQIMYWHLPNKNNMSKMRVLYEGEYWIAKHHDDWYSECRIKAPMVRKALKRIEKRNLIYYTVSGFAGKKSPLVRINWAGFQKAIEKQLSLHSDTMYQSNMTQCIKPNTETTTETTTTKDSDVAESATSGARDDSDGSNHSVLDSAIIATLKAINDYGDDVTVNLDVYDECERRGLIADSGITKSGYDLINSDDELSDFSKELIERNRIAKLESDKRWIAEHGDDSSHDDAMISALGDLPFADGSELSDVYGYKLLCQLATMGYVNAPESLGNTFACDNMWSITKKGHKVLIDLSASGDVESAHDEESPCDACDNSIDDDFTICMDCSYGSHVYATSIEQLPDCAEDTTFDGETQQCLYCDNILELPQAICNHCQSYFQKRKNYGAFTCRVCQTLETADVEYALHTPTGDTWCMECYNSSVANAKTKTANLTMEEFADTIYVQAPQDASDWTHSNFKTCVNCGTQQIVDSDGVCAGCLKQPKVITDCKELDTKDCNNKANSAKKPKLPSADTLMKNALAHAMGYTNEQITVWGDYSKASKLLRNAGATPEDMPGLHSYVKAIQSKQGWEFTSPMAMAKRWAAYQAQKRTSEKIAQQSDSKPLDPLAGVVTFESGE